ncbi:MAG: hypothetical protein ABEH81_03645 [Halopenitus sp.]
MEFRCVCGEVVSIQEDGGESELNVRATCGACETNYAVTITPFGMEPEGSVGMSDVAADEVTAGE